MMSVRICNNIFLLSDRCCKCLCLFEPGDCYPLPARLKALLKGHRIYPAERLMRLQKYYWIMSKEKSCRSGFGSQPTGRNMKKLLHRHSRKESNTHTGCWSLQQNTEERKEDRVYWMWIVIQTTHNTLKAHVIIKKQLLTSEYHKQMMVKHSYTFAQILSHIKIIIYLIIKICW